MESESERRKKAEERVRVLAEIELKMQNRPN
jgi:hypothetical protein